MRAAPMERASFAWHTSTWALNMSTSKRTPRCHLHGCHVTLRRHPNFCHSVEHVEQTYREEVGHAQHRKELQVPDLNMGENSFLWAGPCRQSTETPNKSSNQGAQACEPQSFTLCGCRKGTASTLKFGKRRLQYRQCEKHKALGCWTCSARCDGMFCRDMAVS